MLEISVIFVNIITTIFNRLADGMSGRHGFTIRVGSKLQYRVKLTKNKLRYEYMKQHSLKEMIITPNYLASLSSQSAIVRKPTFLVRNPLQLISTGKAGQTCPVLSI